MWCVLRSSSKDINCNALQTQWQVFSLSAILSHCFAKVTDYCFTSHFLFTLCNSGLSNFLSFINCFIFKMYMILWHKKNKKYYAHHYKNDNKKAIKLHHVL